MKYVDVHTHVHFEAFAVDREEVLRRAREAGVAMITVGTQKDTSRAAVELARASEDVFAAVGLHPIHTSASFHDEAELGAGGKEFTSRGEVFDYDAYKSLAEDPKVVAIGECGLDYYRLAADTKKRQAEAFSAHIALANELKKPLMLHIRNAYDDALAMLRREAVVRGNVHFFAGDWGIAKQFLDLGFTLSFTGVITFAQDYDEVVRNAPLEMIHAETDAPYVAPIPHRGKRNESAYVIEVVRKIGAIKGLSMETVAEALRANARRVFGIA